MSDYNTGNPVPSTDPRDLDDNATVFDLLLQSTDASVPDRLGVNRKTWYQMEQDAAALVSPNVASLASLTLSANKGMYATGASTLATYDLTSLGRTLGGIADAAAGRTALTAAASGANTDITSITGSAATLTTPRSISITGDATWAVSFNGSSNVTAALTLATSGVSAGTYGSVTVNAKGLVTAATVATPIANGGTGQVTAGAALTALGGAPSASPTFTGVPTAPTAAVGTNTAQVASTAMVQAEIANKRTWASYTPTITADSGTFTSISATGISMSAFGIRHVRITVTVTTKGTGTFPIVSLPSTALAGHNGDLLLVREGSTGKMGNALITGSLNSVYISGYDASDLSVTGASIVITGSYPEA